MSNIYVKLIGGAVILFILIMVVGMMLGGKGGGSKQKSTELMLHLDNTASIIDKYQPSVKSSELRSNAASLRGVLQNTSKELATYIETKYNQKDAQKVDKKLTEQAKLEMDALDSDLFEAKINGLLDRIFAHKMASEISAFQDAESALVKSDSSEELRAFLKTSYDSLNNLYSKFNDFSETK